MVLYYYMTTCTTVHYRGPWYCYAGCLILSIQPDEMQAVEDSTIQQSVGTRQYSTVYRMGKFVKTKQKTLVNVRSASRANQDHVNDAIIYGLLFIWC